ncbi:BTB/POZ domain-containing protein [Tanacetum coccineum]
MLHGSLKDATSPVLTLHMDDNNVNREAIAITLAYLYGNHPKLDDSNAFRVLVAVSFLDLHDLCPICIDFIISELCTTNFLAYQRDKIMAYMENVSEMLVGDIFVKAGPWS